MIAASEFRNTKLPLSHGAGLMPVLGFGTLIADGAETISATRNALAAGFRHFDCAERYRNEGAVGEALQAGFAAEGIAREDIFVTTKLWNTNHRPERVEPAFSGEPETDSGSSIWIYISFTPLLHFSPGRIRIRAIRTGVSCRRPRSDFADTWKAMENLWTVADAEPSDFLTSP